ncbi:hypothetical protein EMIT0232MI5_110194 [Pseudomonas sp. IT-232MI5]
MIDVRNRQQQAVAVHQVTAQVVRQLIDRGRREAIARLQQTEEIIAVGHQPVVMHARVALIDRHSVLAMTFLNRRQFLGHQRKRFVPLDRQPLATNATHWLAQAVRIILDVLQGHGFGADVATAEGVEGITLDRGDRNMAIGFGGLDGQPTNGFAQVAGTVMESLGHGQSLSCSGRTITPAGTKLWPRRRPGASDVRLVNRRLSGEPIDRHV